MAALITLLASIIAYAQLSAVGTHERQGQKIVERTAARYVAEAGVVAAQQRLWANPAFTGSFSEDVDGDGTTDVAVTVTDLGSGQREIRAKAVY